MKTATKGGALLLVGALAVLAVGSRDRWSTLDRKEGVQRDSHGRNERTYDDSQKHKIELIVRYRPARVVIITWGIGEEGAVHSRDANDEPSWYEGRRHVTEGTIVDLDVDNDQHEGGYLYAAIEQDDEIVAECPGRVTYGWDVCSLSWIVVGNR